MKDLEKEIDSILNSCDKAFVETLPNSTDTYVAFDDVKEKMLEFCKQLIEKKELSNIDPKSDFFNKLNITEPKLIKFIEDSFFDLKKVKLEKYPDSVFYFKDDKCHFEYDIKTNSVWINCILIWEVLKVKFYFDYHQIKDLTKSIIGSLYYFRDITTIISFVVKMREVEQTYMKK